MDLHPSHQVWIEKRQAVDELLRSIRSELETITPLARSLEVMKTLQGVQQQLGKLHRELDQVSLMLPRS